jgi:hypothetical protein
MKKHINIREYQEKVNNVISRSVVEREELLLRIEQLQKERDFYKNSFFKLQELVRQLYLHFFTDWNVILPLVNNEKSRNIINNIQQLFKIRK